MPEIRCPRCQNLLREEDCQVREGYMYKGIQHGFRNRMPHLWIHWPCWGCSWVGEWQAENDIRGSRKKKVAA